MSHLRDIPPPARWIDSVLADGLRIPPSPPLVGVLTGEGIGPEVIANAIEVLHAVRGVTGCAVSLEYGAPIGRDAERGCGKPLSDEVITFCRDIFDRGGAILNGPGGGRYVYDLRRQFDLFCKLSPLKVFPELADAIRLKPEQVRDIDILMVRENAAGLYQGRWRDHHLDAGRVAEHSFSYSEAQVRRILGPAARLAKTRRGHLTVVVKEAGVPGISGLWRECALDVCARLGLACALLDIDHIAYRLIQHPREFDVVVAPNLFGDILSDLGGVLLGSRGLCFAGSFSETGAAVYQTNHGAAYDLAGKDLANPVGQIFSLAMMLRESFGLAEEAALIEQAVARVWREGWRTADVAGMESRIIGTREMGRRIAEAMTQIPRILPALRPEMPAGRI
ncbi:MAG TPA: isocitrate/isopropylmalate family dehydrogenase [Chthoniobacterales bacterium]